MSIHVCTQLYTHVYTTVYTRVHNIALGMSPVGLSPRSISRGQYLGPLVMGQGSLRYEIIPPKVQMQECASEIMRRP